MKLYNFKQDNLKQNNLKQCMVFALLFLVTGCSSVGFLDDADKQDAADSEVVVEADELIEDQNDGSSSLFAWFGSDDDEVEVEVGAEADIEDVEEVELSSDQSDEQSDASGSLFAWFGSDDDETEAAVEELELASDQSEEQSDESAESGSWFGWFGSDSIDEEETTDVAAVEFENNVEDDSDNNNGSMFGWLGFGAADEEVEAMTFANIETVELYEGDDREDIGLTAVIEYRLGLDQHINNDRISVDTKDAVVTLTGTVPSAEMYNRVNAIAKSTEGVEQVVSYMVIVTER